MNDPILIGTIGFLVMLGFAGLGIPIGIALGIVAAAGLWYTAGFLFMSTTLTSMPYEFVNNYTFVVLPMFVLMGSLASSSGIVTDLYKAAYVWTSGIRGGLLQATVLAAAGFAAISGSTVASAAIFTRIALPEIIRYNYNKAIGAGAICAAGLLAGLIPPSIAFVIYGFLTGESIGQLLIAGVIPGVLTAAVFMVGIAVMIWWRPHWAPSPKSKVGLTDRVRSLKNLWPTLAVVILVFGGLYSGLMPASSAGAVGVSGVVIVSLLKRSLTLESTKESLRETLILTSVLTIIILGGFLFGRFLTLSGFMASVLGFLNAADVGKAIFLATIVAFYLILGCFIDTVTIAVVAVPILHPLAIAMGIHPVWFAVFIVKLGEIGAITPPVGLNLFAVVASAEGRLKMGELYLGILPFVFMELITLTILFIWPELATWLPSKMIK